MPTSSHNLMVIGTLCEEVCSMIYGKAAVTVLSPTIEVLLRGWREATYAKLWTFSLLPNAQLQPPPQTSTTPKENSDYNISIVAALIRYLHASAGFAVKSTCIAAIKAFNYASWPAPLNIFLTQTKCSKDTWSKLVRACNP